MHVIRQAEALKIFADLVQKVYPSISSSTLELLCSGMRLGYYEPRNFFLHAGMHQTDIGFVVSGLVRAFYTDKQGDEITIEFFCEQDFVTYYSSLESLLRTRFSFQSIEPTTMLLLPYEHLRLCLREHLEVEGFLRRVLEEAHSRLLRRLEYQLLDDASQRYCRFASDYPDLLSRVSVTDLCSYLGVSRQTLTRIRRRLLQG